MLDKIFRNFKNKDFFESKKNLKVPLWTTKNYSRDDGSYFDITETGVDKKGFKVYLLNSYFKDGSPHILEAQIYSTEDFMNPKNEQEKSNIVNKSLALKEINEIGVGWEDSFRGAEKASFLFKFDVEREEAKYCCDNKDIVEVYFQKNEKLGLYSYRVDGIISFYDKLYLERVSAKIYTEEDLIKPKNIEHAKQIVNLLLDNTYIENRVRYFDGYVGYIKNDDIKIDAEVEKQIIGEYRHKNQYLENKIFNFYNHVYHRDEIIMFPERDVHAVYTTDNGVKISIYSCPLSFLAEETKLKYYNVSCTSADNKKLCEGEICTEQNLYTPKNEQEIKDIANILLAPERLQNLFAMNISYVGVIKNGKIIDKQNKVQLEAPKSQEKKENQKLSFSKLIQIKEALFRGR